VIGRSAALFIHNLASDTAALSWLNLIFMRTKTHSPALALQSAVTPLSQPASTALRILLAEDNSVNLRIAVQILKNLGHLVTAFTTANEVTQVVGPPAFDLVILGCDEADGEVYEAVQTIRRKELKGEHIPIIALTANTLQCDRKKREAASFDDYIAVPIDPQSMAAVIHRWDQKSTISSSFKLTAIDRNMIRSIQSIAGDGSTELLNELIELFLSSTPQRIEEMELALQEGDPVKLYRPAHSLKGSSGQMGAVRLQQICGSLEAVGKAGTLNGVAPLIQELKAEMERVSQDLHHIQMEKLEDPNEEPDDVMPTPGPDVLAIAPAFKGKRILALDLYPGILSQLKSVLKSFECELGTIEPSFFDEKGWAARASLLLLGAKIGDTTALEQCIQWREKGEEIPIIVVTGALDPKMLACIEALEADFVLEPFRADDLLLRAHQKLNMPAPALVKKPQGATSEILVAEDDALIARFLSNALKGAGYHVTHAEDGESAMAAIRQNAFQLVILDITMPKIDGFGVLSQMRLEKHYSQIPVLMLTSRVHEHDVVRAFDLGVDDYVTKPFNPLEVVSRVRRLLKRR
jgi:DNA-binding response OmpR family regulator